MTAVFDPSLLNVFRDVTNDVLQSVQEAGVLLYARHQVTMVFRAQSAKLPQYGFQGNSQDQKVVFDPQPEVDLRTQYRQRDGIVVAVGDAKLSKIPQIYTRDQLTKDVTHFLIGGDVYTYVGGSIKDISSGIFWEIILKKEETSKK